MLFLSPVSSANEQCRKASAHGEFYLFGLRLEGMNHCGFSTLVCLPGGLGRMAAGQGEQMWSPLGKPRRGMCVVGGRQEHHLGPSPVPVCAGHVVSSPGLGSRVPAYLRNRERMSGSALWGVSSPDGTDSISGEQTLGFCGLLCSDLVRKGSHV